jgi:pimeloyl-ACP methyl ester carboxylesterase
MSTSTFTLPTSIGDIPVTVTERGQGAPVLLLHGGAGPDSVAGFADLLAERCPVRALTPVNPGFGGTPRPAGSIRCASLPRSTGSCSTGSG